MKVLGVMSGTSLDGLDICYAEFYKNKNNWHFSNVKGQTFKYSSSEVAKLRKRNYSGVELIGLHRWFGEFIAEKVLAFLQFHKLEVDIISSHGHTIFHQPENKINFQCGDGSRIAAITGIDTICDFRSTDINLGGQGAPLVPIGDRELFTDFDACINLGGFCNISFQQSQLYAFDIAPCNIALNFLSAQLGKPFDDRGMLAASGKLIPTILKNLNNLPFYEKTMPKSLGDEWLKLAFLPLINDPNHTIEDKLHTIVKHIVQQICHIIKKYNLNSILLSGGGCYNDYLVKGIKKNCHAKIEIPNNEIINFKEALIFGFLGLKYELNELNVLNSYTGASRNSISGAKYKG